MGILSGLFRSRDKPTDRTAGSSYSFFLGGTASKQFKQNTDNAGPGRDAGVFFVILLK